MNNQKEPENQTQYMPIFMCLGISVGMAVGSAAGNIGIGMCLGVGIGMCLGVCLDALQNKKTGKELCFLPMYIAPSRKEMHFGEMTRFSAQAPIHEERSRICHALMDAITEIAENLPEHTVVPYRNIPKREYPTNKSKESAYEKAGR